MLHRIYYLQRQHIMFHFVCEYKWCYPLTVEWRWEVSQNSLPLSHLIRSFHLNLPFYSFIILAVVPSYGCFPKLSIEKMYSPLFAAIIHWIHHSSIQPDVQLYSRASEMNRSYCEHWDLTTVVMSLGSLMMEVPPVDTSVAASRLHFDVISRPHTYFHKTY